MGILVIAAWVQVDFGLRPLEAVRRKLTQVRAGEARRLGPAFPDEVRPLASEVDVERELARARVGGGVTVSSRQPARPVIEQVVKVISRTPQGSRLQWEILASDHVCTRMATEDLAEIVGNLAENAANWATAEPPASTPWR